MCDMEEDYDISMSSLRKLLRSDLERHKVDRELDQ